MGREDRPGGRDHLVQVPGEHSAVRVGENRFQALLSWKVHCELRAGRSSVGAQTIVSILVILEGALRVPGAPGEEGVEVSILVLLEGALRARLRIGIIVDHRIVSILVILEGALRGQQGPPSRGDLNYVSILVILEGALRGSRSRAARERLTMFVSILVILEGALRGTRSGIPWSWSGFQSLLSWKVRCEPSARASIFPVQ